LHTPSFLVIFNSVEHALQSTHTNNGFHDDIKVTVHSQIVLPKDANYNEVEDAFYPDAQACDPAHGWPRPGIATWQDSIVQIRV